MNYQKSYLLATKILALKKELSDLKSEYRNESSDFYSEAKKIGFVPIEIVSDQNDPEPVGTLLIRESLTDSSFSFLNSENEKEFFFIREPDFKDLVSKLKEGEDYFFLPEF